MSKSLNLLTATAGDVQRDLISETLTSVELVNACLDQIEQHDDYLNAVISKAPRAHLVEQAQSLDVERKMKGIRSKLHGIPILIKLLPSLFVSNHRPDPCIQDNIATLPEYHMDTTAGSLALAGSKPKKNADIVERVKHLLRFAVRHIADSNAAYWSRSHYHRQGKHDGKMTSAHPQPFSHCIAHSYP